jgi:uncharacterized membrane protein YozB (DUF420 family)
MRIALGFCAVLCLAILGFGIHLVLEEQRQVMSFSATTTAVVLTKRVAVHTFQDPDSEYSLEISFEPVVTFRYEVHGQQFTGNSVFRSPFVIGGDIGAAFVRAAVDRFEIGQETPVYYRPANPTEACLIRRPSLYVYLVILGPMIPLSLVVSVWPLPQAGSVPNHRRKGRWIAALWYLVVLAGGAHYFCLAGADGTESARWLFGIFTYVGLIPVAVALPSSGRAQRVKVAILASFYGMFFGLFPGLAAALLADWVWQRGVVTSYLCVGYSAAVGAAVFAMLALAGVVTQARVASGGKEGDEERGMHPDFSNRHQSEPESVYPSAYTAPADGIPYRIDQRPLPSGEDLEALLPARVGPFRRTSIKERGLNKPIYAEYHSQHGEVFVELGICHDPAEARRGVETSKAETDAEFPEATHRLSLETEPSFFLTDTPRGAFLSWTRGRYYFSAHAKHGEADLNRFIAAFPY